MKDLWCWGANSPSFTCSGYCDEGGPRHPSQLGAHRQLIHPWWSTMVICYRHLEVQLILWQRYKTQQISLPSAYFPGALKSPRMSQIISYFWQMTIYFCFSQTIFVHSASLALFICSKLPFLIITTQKNMHFLNCKHLEEQRNRSWKSVFCRTVLQVVSVHKDVIVGCGT